MLEEVLVRGEGFDPQRRLNLVCETPFKSLVYSMNHRQDLYRLNAILSGYIEMTREREVKVMYTDE